MNKSGAKPHPWRRFFARTLDLCLYYTLFGVVYFLLLRMPPKAGNGLNILTSLVGIMLMFIIEPVLIANYTTTFGKWILGIRVRNEDGEKLSYSQALERTWGVFRFGEGFSLPIYNWIRHYISYKAYTQGEPLPWDINNSYTFKDTKRVRIFVLTAAIIFLFCADLLMALHAQLPRNRGDISIAQFAENYNKYLDYFDMNPGKKLGINGEWEEKHEYGGTVYLPLSSQELPQYRYTEENGILTGVSFEAEYEGDEWVGGYDNHIAVAVISFVCAQKDVTIWNGRMNGIVEFIKESILEDFCFTEAGITVTREIEYRGYTAAPLGLLIPDESNNQYFRIAFTMVKDDSRVVCD